MNNRCVFCGWRRPSWRGGASSLLLAAFLLCGRGVAAQDTRTVEEPKFPPLCTRLSAKLIALKSGISPDDEGKLDTQRIQSAVAGCAAGTAVELEPDGDRNAFLSGPIEMKPGITLLIAANATLFASRNPRDYDVRPGSCGLVDNDGKGCRPLLHFVNAPDAGVMGDGAIDGRGGATLIGQKGNWWDLAQQAKAGNRKQNVPRIIVTDGSNNFTLYRITLRNSPNFHVLVSRTDGFTAWGVKIDAPATARNTDGIDPASSTNVSILYSYIRDGDDNVAIKAGDNGPSTHMTIAYDHFYSGHGMSIGSETNGGASDIVVHDLTIEGADNGIRIKSDASRGGLVHDVRYQDVCMRDVKNPILIDPFYSEATGNEIPLFRDILLRNIVIATPGKIVLKGHDAGHASEITMDGVAEMGVKPELITASHAHLTFGPGEVNFTPAGDDVRVSEINRARTKPSCTQQFVPFPEGPGVN